MDMSFSIIRFTEILQERKGELLQELFRHINMTAIALLLSVIVGVSLGILISRNKTLADIIIGIANIMQSVPCIALLAISVCFVGIGTSSAVFMVFVYSFLPILKSTYIGIKNISPSHLEVAKGLGLTTGRSLLKIEIPIAIPYIMSGIRIAAVSAVGTMTIAAFAGAKGLGWFINLGLNSLNIELILLGAIPVSLLALLVDFVFSKFEDIFTSEGLLPTDQIKNKSKTSVKKTKTIFLLAFTIVSLIVIISPLVFIN